MSTKPKPYSPQEIQRLTSQYRAQPSMQTVLRLVEETGRTKSSVIAKLSSLGVYKKAQRKSKQGREVITRAQIAQRIGQYFGLDLETLSKAGKLDLVALHDALRDPVMVRAHLVDLQYDERQNNGGETHST